MRAPLWSLALAAGAGLAAMAATGATEHWLDVLDSPALASPLASRSLVNGLAAAGGRIVAAGQRGHILFSDDAGKTWSQASVPVSSDLVAVHFPTPSDGWAVGHDGVILHSADAGKSWARQRDGRPAEADVPLLDVWFDDARAGYAVGAFGTLLRTTDGGLHWESLKEVANNPKGMHLYAVRRVAGELFIGGEQGLMLRLDAASGRFSAIELPYKGTFFGIVGNERTVIAYGLRGNVVRSTDAGATWQPVPTGLAVGLTGGAVDSQGRFLLASQAGHVLVSSNDGATFTPLKLERPAPAAAVLGLAGGGLVIAGSRGLHTAPMR